MHARVYRFFQTCGNERGLNLFWLCYGDYRGTKKLKQFFYFDNSILDIYSMMKTGATLYVIPKKLFSQPVLLLEYLKENEINTIFWVPSALITVAKIRALKNVDLKNTIKRVLFCGEVMPNKQLNYWRQNLENAVYANLYGRQRRCCQGCCNPHSGQTA